MLGRPLGQIAGFTAPTPGGNALLLGWGISTNTTAGSATLTAPQIMRGVLNRTGPGAGFTDTWPDADAIIAAMDNPQVGDSWALIYRNGVAQAMTFAAGTGIVSGIGTLSCAASSTKTYLHTVLSNKRTTIKTGTTTNTSPVLTNLPASAAADIMPGMGVTGTNVAAAAIVLGVAQVMDANGLITTSVTVNGNSTGTADNVVLTFFPRVQLDALGVQTN